MNRLLFELACSFAAKPNVQPLLDTTRSPGGRLFVFAALAMGHFGLDGAADLIYDKAEGCCPGKWGGGGCPKEKI